MQSWPVDEESVGQRLDVFISAKISGLSRSSVQKLTEQKKVTVNKKIEKASYKLKVSDMVQIDFDVTKLAQVPIIELPILYEDDDCIVINKPVGALTHSKGVFNPESTVATFIAPKLHNMTGERAGIVHRLDRATSGVIITAKTPEALSWLQKQFSQRKVKKTYVAIVEGNVEPSEAVIEVPIERSPKAPQTFRAGTNGKFASTHYKVIAENKQYSKLELSPKTGRTHQLRVHLNYLGHPIVGDTLYGGKKADRLYLHAQKLEITLPSRERKVFSASLPNEFNAIIR